jgi:hypothetical protein
LGWPLFKQLKGGFFFDIFPIFAYKNLSMRQHKFLIIISCYFYFVSCNKHIATDVNKKNKLLFEPIKVVSIHKADGLIGPCEPSIAINPLNTDNIVAGSVLDNVYVSNDGGSSWKRDKLKSPYNVYGDPVIRFNQDGSVMYAHLSNPANKAYNSEEFLDRIIVQLSKDQGRTWSDGTYPKGNQKKDHDKQWLHVNPIDKSVLMAWTEFDKYGSKDDKDKSRILFSKSMDGGQTWADAISISDIEGNCIDDDMTTEGAHPCVGIDGTYYAVWSFDSKIYLDISTDKGKTWSTDVVIADQVNGWTLDIPGIGRCNGMPIFEVDYSNGKHRGTLYVSWADQRNGENNTDIWIISSKDNGKSWSKPIRVNDDFGQKHQFFAWMDIDPTTGIIYIVFYDRRNHEDNNTDVYLAYSMDGGNSFENIKISEAPFVPSEDIFFGDYNDISAYDGKIRPIWTSLENKTLSIQTALINVKR